MARMTDPSVGVVLDRWAEPYIIGINSQMNHDGQLWGASLEVDGTDGRISMAVTGVETTTSGAIVMVARMFDQFRHAPTDATVLAREVERLRKRVKQLQVNADHAPTDEQ